MSIHEQAQQLAALVEQVPDGQAHAERLRALAGSETGKLLRRVLVTARECLAGF